MTISRRARRLVLAVTALVLVGVGIAGPASASEVAGTYAGNSCSTARWYVDNSGAEACVWRDAFVVNNYITIRPGAFDYARDGLSADNYTVVDQFYPGYGWYQTAAVRITASRGYGYSQIGQARTVYKQAGASALRVRVRACTYDTPTSTYYSCAWKTVASGNWSG